MELHIFNGKVLCRIADEHQDSKVRKLHIDLKKIDTINKSLVEQQESHMSEDEKPTTSDNIKVDVPKYKEEAVRNMPRNYEKVCSDQLRDIKSTELRTDLKQDSDPSKSPLYQAV